MRVLLSIIAATLSFSATSCVIVPSMDGASNVSLDDVAWRVKCDIWKFVARKVRFPTDKGYNKHDPYVFLAGWGARVHLTLAVDDTGSLNPGATLIQPLPSSQSRSLGIGAGVTTEAVSTTDFEFFLSFAEIHEEFKHAAGPVEGYCPAPRGLLLESDLRIDELFNRALEPVTQRTLMVGQHPGIGSSSPPATPKDQIPKYSEYNAVFEKLRTKHFETNAAGLTAPTVDDNKQIAQLEETKAQAYISNIVKPIAEILVASFPACVSDVTQLRNEAIIEAALVSADKIEVDKAKNIADSQKAVTELQQQMSGTPSKADSGLEAKVNDMLKQLKTCPGRKPKPTAPTEYDPFDLVSQTINFYITSSGSVTPTWKLVNVSAPVASTFASLSRKDTNTLIIAFGRPDLTKGSTSNTAISNQILTSTLKDALSGRIAP
jgi:hypothetical protein